MVTCKPWIALCGRVLGISVMKLLGDLDDFASLCGKEAPGAPKARGWVRRTSSGFSRTLFPVPGCWLYTSPC